MPGMQRGCRVLGKGTAGRGGTESRKGTGRKGEGEGSNAQRLLDVWPRPRLEERASPDQPHHQLGHGGDCEGPMEALWAAGMGLGWGFGQGQQSLCRMLPPASVSNLADPHPDPCSSLICLSSKAVKLIPIPAKSHGFHPSPPSSSMSLAGAWWAAASVQHGWSCSIMKEKELLPAGSQTSLQQPHGPSRGRVSLRAIMGTGGCDDSWGDGLSLCQPGQAPGPTLRGAAEKLTSASARRNSASLAHPSWGQRRKQGPLPRTTAR